MFNCGFILALDLVFQFYCHVEFEIDQPLNWVKYIKSDDIFYGRDGKVKDTMELI